MQKIALRIRSSTFFSCFILFLFGLVEKVQSNSNMDLTSRKGPRHKVPISYWKSVFTRFFLRNSFYRSSFKLSRLLGVGFIETCNRSKFSRYRYSHSDIVWWTNTNFHFVIHGAHSKRQWKVATCNFELGPGQGKRRSWRIAREKKGR